MFRVGQEVVCIEGGVWENENGIPRIGNHPKKGDICIISDIKQINRFLMFMEYDEAFYDYVYFKPLQDNFATDTLKDVRIKQLEHELKELKKLKNPEILTNE